jgi:iron-sulfur cluster assembly protein
MHYDTNGVRVFVDPKNLPYVDGMIIDYVRQGLNEGFEFRNPNERDRCGCGESFRI